MASLYSSMPFHQDASILMIGERTNANGSKAFREAMIAEDWQKCLDIAKDQTRDGAHLLDLCVDYVGRDGVADMNALASRLATRRRCRSCWTPPKPRCCERVWSTSAAGARSTR